MQLPARFLITFILLLPACSSVSNSSLYEELGGEQGVEAIVDGFLYQLGEDDRIIDFFAESNIDRFREKLIEQICELSGGPCEYTGDSMIDSHRGMNISEAHFNALVEDLILAMEAEQVPTPAQNRLLALLAPMHDDIRFPPG